MNKLNLDYKFSVAPMMGVTTSSARYMYRLISKEAVLFTEMIASQALHRGDFKKMLKKESIESPVILQVGGSDINLLKYSSELANKHNYQGINLNVGCPSKKVSQGKMGACLMKEATLVKQCLEGMISETSIDVSLKCRIGVDEFDTYEFFKSFISTVIESGIKIIFIHARKAYLKGLDPKRNRTLPPLKYEFVYKIKKEFPHIKFIINGGLDNIDDCLDQLNYLDGVMVGRSIQANPFFLEDVDSKFYHLEKIEIDRSFVVKKYFDYVKENIDLISTYELLSPLLALCFGVPGSKKFKQEINDLIRSRDIQKLEYAYLNLIAA
ncbi:tRNA dihydrouridine(20/20a) synthase DusA [Pelagibacteraceae bacterium]|nr:tRNA dihydrouridine(20/20a) synthase DusA [Pelagibacteraceae bacterium]